MVHTYTAQRTWGSDRRTVQLAMQLALCERSVCYTCVVHTSCMMMVHWVRRVCKCMVGRRRMPSIWAMLLVESSTCHDAVGDSLRDVRLVR